MNAKHYPIFRQHPQVMAMTSKGEVPTPYQIYDGYGAFIGGYADLMAVQQFLQDERVVPIQTQVGKALMGIWVCDFTDASLDPHHELQLSFFVGRELIQDLPPHPLSLLAAMLTRPEIEMLCHGLWNNTPIVVAYNRELLGLNAKLSRGTLARNREYMNFTIYDAETGELLLDGLLNNGRVSWRANAALISQLGLKQMWIINRKPWLGMKVANPVSDLFPENLIVETLTRNDSNRLRFFDSRIDKLNFGNIPYAALGFQPQFVQHMDGIKFIYPSPRQT